MIDKKELMKQIKDEVFNLADSPLYAYRAQNKYFPVIGQGSHDAKIMFVGEAPGQNEAKTGVPFCGAAGKILDQALEKIELKREDVYITNIVKDRPPQNRDPLPEEIVAYGPFLDRQIDIIQPKVIVTLGRYSMTYIMKILGIEQLIEPISKAHGRVYKGKASYGEVIIIPQYHPAATIYNRELIEVLYKDFQVIKEYV